MRQHQMIGLASLAIIPATFAAGVLELAVETRTHQRVNTALQKRADVNGTIDQSLFTYFADTEGLGYYLNITVGTPAQDVTVQLDTGSSDLWVPAVDAAYCSTKSGCVGGSFDASKSSSSTTVVENGMNLTYGDGSNYAGDYIKESVQVGDIIIEGVQLGVGSTGTGSVTGVTTGIMGLGYSRAEGAAKLKNIYPNFVEALVGSGAIASRLYSVYLNSLSQYGSVLFGGVDTEKYSGNLTTLNLVNNDETNTISRPLLTLEKVTINVAGEVTTMAEPDSKPSVYPDTGSTDWIVYDELYTQILQFAGVTVKNSKLRSCNDLPNATVSITFGGNGTDTATLDVPLSTMFRPATLTTGKPAVISGELQCILAVSSSGSLTNQVDFLLVGDSIMRAGYWVFDLDNGQISVAQAKLASTESNVVGVEAGTKGLSKAVGGLANSEVPTQKAYIEPTISASASYGLKTADSTVGFATGAQPTLTGFAGLSAAPPSIWLMTVALSCMALMM